MQQVNTEGVQLSSHQWDLVQVQLSCTRSLETINEIAEHIMESSTARQLTHLEVELRHAADALRTIAAGPDTLRAEASS